MLPLIPTVQLYPLQMCFECNWKINFIQKMHWKVYLTFWWIQHFTITTPGKSTWHMVGWYVGNKKAKVLYMLVIIMKRCPNNQWTGGKTCNVSMFFCCLWNAAGTFCHSYRILCCVNSSLLSSLAFIILICVSYLKHHLLQIFHL